MSQLFTDYQNATPIMDVINSDWLARLPTHTQPLKLIHHIGCRIGSRTDLLSKKYPKTHIVGIDNEPWISCAQERYSQYTFVDRETPLTELADWIVLEHCLQTPEEWQISLENCHHNLNEEGLFSVITFGPNTFKNCAFQSEPHFQDMHDLGDLLLRTGFNQVVMSSEKITIEYTSQEALSADAQILFDTPLISNTAMSFPILVEIEVIYGDAKKTQGRPSHTQYVAIPKRK